MALGKRYQPEQVVNLLRQIEVAVANGKRQRRRARKRKSWSRHIPLAQGVWRSAGRTTNPEELEQENAKPKRLVAELSRTAVSRTSPREIPSPERRRSAASHACERGLSERACVPIGESTARHATLPADTA